MNRTYNNSIRNTRAYSSSARIDIAEILSYIFSAIYNFVTNEAVILITKLVICFASITVIFLMMCLNAGGVLPFATTALVTIAMVALSLFTFKTMY